MSNNKKQAPTIPESIEVISAFWDLSVGEHPYLAVNDNLFNVTMNASKTLLDHFQECDIPLIACKDGHNTMADATLPDALETDIKAPISPNFVKDIAGRTIYIGYGPEAKKESAWNEPSRLTFPKFCRLLNKKTNGTALLENVFMTRFRSLDTSTKYEDNTHLQLFTYKAVNLHPYKLRPDTFYQDGWRIPQTNMLYTRNVDEEVSSTAAKELMSEWASVKGYESPLDFFDRMGDRWIKDLFAKGCSIIPTENAKNGYFKVGDNFEILGQHSGRAVEGLHEIIESKVSEFPKGTILETIELGYATSYKIHPAKVIVSDGSRYTTNTKNLAEALHPDLSLPHQRTMATWGTTWIPTHPHHFNEPAIWGWCPTTGRFLQASGPIWDPLHYYYESVDLIVEAFKKPLAHKRYLAKVPEEMKGRFYPVSSINGFDIVSKTAKDWRVSNNILPLSAISRIHDDIPSSTIGYHPMPIGFEYELMPDWFSEFMPLTRLKNNQRPAHIKIMPVIKSYISPQDYLANAPDIREYEHLLKVKAIQTAEGTPTNDYPYLKRYMGTAYDEEKHIPYLNAILMLQPNEIELHQHVSISYLENMSEETSIELYNAFSVMKEAARNMLLIRSYQYYEDKSSFFKRLWECK